MGLELKILGIRKIKEEEINELTGKTWEEMEKCKYFRQFFPCAEYHSCYWSYSQKEISKDDRYKSIKHMLSPVKDENGNDVYVMWVEHLAYYWQKNPYDDEQIDSFFEDIDDVDWEQSFHVVLYDDISSYTRRKPSVMDTKEELVAFIYG